jgi:hypothetical protein
MDEGTTGSMKLICKDGFLNRHQYRPDLLMHESEKAGVSSSLSKTYMHKQKKTSDQIHSLQKYSAVETL